PGPCARAATGASTTHSAMNKPATRARPFKKDVIYVSRLYRNEVRKRKWNASVARTRRAIGARRPLICDRRAQDRPDRTGQVDHAEIRALEDRARQVGAAQAAAIERGVGEIGVDQIRVLGLHAAKLRVLQIAAWTLL